MWTGKVRVREKDGDEGGEELHCFEMVMFDSRVVRRGGDWLRRGAGGQAV